MMFSLSTILFAQSADYKVVAYLPGYRTATVDTSIGKYIDDLIYFNLRVDSSANLTEEVISEEGLALVAAIKEKYNVRTQICIAGWWTTTGIHFAPVVTNDSLRANLIQNILDFCLEYGFDGIDYDWEHPQNDEELEIRVLLYGHYRIAYLIKDDRPVR